MASSSSLTASSSFDYLGISDSHAAIEDLHQEMEQEMEQVRQKYQNRIEREQKRIIEEQCMTCRSTQDFGRFLPHFEGQLNEMLSHFREKPDEIFMAYVPEMEDFVFYQDRHLILGQTKTSCPRVPVSIKVHQGRIYVIFDDYYKCETEIYQDRNHVQSNGESFSHWILCR